MIKVSMAIPMGNLPEEQCKDTLKIWAHNHNVIITDFEVRGNNIACHGHWGVALVPVDYQMPPNNTSRSQQILTYSEQKGFMVCWFEDDRFHPFDCDGEYFQPQHWMYLRTLEEAEVRGGEKNFMFPRQTKEDES